MDPEWRNFVRCILKPNGHTITSLLLFGDLVKAGLIVQKAPAATVETLAKAVLELYKSESKINIIGVRHGEKLYETLVNREDMVKANDMGDYYRIPADNRDLNYEQYYSEGIPETINVEEYHSHNTSQLDIEGMKKLLLKLPINRRDILGDLVAVLYPY
jgi:UDP-N-acetylglucosamine 4,6-dehydratase